MTPSENADRVRVKVEDLMSFATDVFASAGLANSDAAVVVQCLLTAEARGTHSHGLIRLPFLVKRLQDHGANTNPKMALISEAPATALLDADYALGPVAASRAMHMAIDKALTQGIGLVSVKNSDFFGTCAHWAMMALEHDMIGIAWANGFPGMAPWNGRESAIGNNPLGFAIPRTNGAPLVLDMAMSVAAGGKVRVAAEKNEQIPADWILDKDGRLTTNPNDLAGGGVLLPLGYKGFGLAVVGEALVGILSGARILRDIPAWFKATGEHVGNGHMHIAIDVAKFIDPQLFKSRVDEMVSTLKSTPLLLGADEILMPGERAWRSEQESREKGILLHSKVLFEIRRVGQSLGVELRT